MIVVLRPKAGEEQESALREWLKSRGIEAQTVSGKYQKVLGLVGDISTADGNLLESFEIVESVKRISEPYRLSGRKLNSEDRVIEVCGKKLGGGGFQVIAGPCCVESEEQICEIAEAVKSSGAGLLRGGAFKPRTSPYDFQGLRGEGLRLLSEAKRRTGLPIVSEIMSPEQLPLFEDVDMLQVGARNMQNFELLKELGSIDKPVLLKRGLSATVKELLTSAEYIMSGGNERVILCERGIRTFEFSTRNTLDLSAVPVIHELSGLPVIVDPSHATGHSKYVPSMALAAAAAGADGLIIEVHNDPVNSLCDGAQAITPSELSELMKKINAVREAIS